MCIAIGPLQETQRSALGRLWWHLAETPVRLLGGAALVHALVLLYRSNSDSSPEVVLLAVTAIGGLALFALLMNRFPHWSGRSPIHYMRYGAMFLLFSLALLPLESGAALDGYATWSLTLIAIAWALGLHGLHGYCGWMRAEHRLKARALLSTLYLGAILSGAGLLLMYP